MFTRILFAVLLILLSVAKAAQAADAPAPKSTDESLRNDTAGVLVITQDGQELGLVFISKTGQILPESITACEASKECATLMQKLHDTQHMTLIQLPSAKPDKPDGTQV